MWLTDKRLELIIPSSVVEFKAPNHILTDIYTNFSKALSESGSACFGCSNKSINSMQSPILDETKFVLTCNYGYGYTCPEKARVVHSPLSGSALMYPTGSATTGTVSSTGISSSPTDWSSIANDEAYFRDRNSFMRDFQASNSQEVVSFKKERERMLKDVPATACDSW